MKQVTGKQFYYHITHQDFGNKILLAPLHTTRYGTPNRPMYSESPDISRICVSPMLANCLLAIPLKRKRIYKVYRTLKKISPYYPIDVCDSRITREKWVLERTVFIFRMELPKELINYFLDHHITYTYPRPGDIGKVKKILKKYNINNTL